MLLHSYFSIKVMKLEVHLVFLQCVPQVCKVPYLFFFSYFSIVFMLNIFPHSAFNEENGNKSRKCNHH